MGKIRIKIPGLGSKAAPVTSRSAEIRAQRLAAEREALEQQQLTGTTDDILEAEAVTGAPDVANFQKQLGEGGELSPIQKKFGGEAMEHQVYPDGKPTVAQEIGSALTGVGRRLSNTKDFFKENIARQLGGQDEARAVISKQAESSTATGGLKGASTATEDSVSSFLFNLKGEVEGIEGAFRTRYRALGDLSLKESKGSVSGAISKLMQKHGSKKTRTGGADSTEPTFFAQSDEGKAMLGEMDEWLRAIDAGEMTETEVLRALRRRVGERTYATGKGGKDLPEQHAMQRLNKDMRKLFDDTLEAKGKELKKNLPILRRKHNEAVKRGDTETAAKLEKAIESAKGFAEKARAVDKDYSRYMSLKTKATPGSGDIDAVELFKMLDNPVSASRYLNGMVGDLTNGVTRLRQFRKRIEAIEKVSGDKGLSSKVESNLQETLAHKLFGKDIHGESIGTNFKAFLESKNGRTMMKEVWPDSADMIDQWSYVMRRTSDKANLSSWISRAFATYLGPGMAAGLLSGGGATVAAGATVGLAVGGAATIGTMVVIGGMLKSQAFRNFAIKQFSKEPYKEYKALGKLGDILEKVGGNRENAKRVLDWMTGSTIVLGGANVAHDVLVVDPERDEKFNTLKAKYGGETKVTQEEIDATNDKYDKLLEQYE